MKVSQWAVIKPLISLFFSRKFLVLFIAALASSGIAAAADVEEWIPVIVMAGAAINAVMIAWEDSASKRAGNEPD